MKTIGVRNLKATLSQVLRDVQRGDVYLVTDRGHAVAELRSPRLDSPSHSAEDRAFARLAAAGHVRLAERPAPEYRRTGLKSPAGLARRLITEDRGE